MTKFFSVISKTFQSMTQQ